MGHRANGEIPPFEPVPQARRGDPDRGEPLRLPQCPRGSTRGAGVLSGGAVETNRARGTRPTVPFAWFALAVGVVILETITHLADFGLDNLGIRLLDSSYEWSYSHLLAT